MTAIYSPAGFEQIFKDRLLHPNRTPAEAAAVRKNTASSIGMARNDGGTPGIPRVDGCFPRPMRPEHPRRMARLWLE